MDFRETRGVSELLGAILLFGLLISLLIIVQATAVPSANEQVEFSHNQQVQGDMLQLADDIDSVAVSGSDQLSVIEMGVRYPNRFLLFNPPPAAGALSTTGDASFTIANARATGEVGDYWNGDAVPFTSQSIEYRPSYNVYQGAPDTRYESGILVNAFENGNANVVGGDTFIEGNRINLIAVQGSRDVSQTSALSLDVVPLSAPSKTVTVRDTGTPITITITTDLPASRWETILEEELEANGGKVRSVTDGTGDTVEIELVPGQSYSLRLASVGVGGGVSSPGAHYVTTISDSEVTLDSSDDPTEITVEVRDAFNTPVANAEVTFSSSGGTFSDATVTTDAEGHATTTFTASSRGTKIVTATIDDGVSGTTPRERATILVNAGATGNERLADEYINSGYNSDVLLSRTSSGTVGGGGGGTPYTDLTFENVGTQNRKAVAARLIGVYSDGGKVESVTYAGATLIPGGQYRTLSDQYEINGLSSVERRMTYTPTSVSGTKAQIILAIEYANGDISRYTIQTGTSTNQLTAADRVTVASSTTTGSGDSGMAVSFTVAGSAKTVTGIRIDDTSAGADTVEWGSGREVRKPGTVTGYEGTMNIGEIYDTSDAGWSNIALSNGNTIEVQQFHAGSDRLDMAGETVTFTLYFSDGSERTYTVTLPSS